MNWNFLFGSLIVQKVHDIQFINIAIMNNKEFVIHGTNIGFYESNYGIEDKIKEYKLL